ncbi:unnamed protein product [Rhizophagus irregularis]|uniref:Uncharacterized protein n=1 Tax=Rhizophagus irregularis TaxID=588596 RepID=A0A916EKL6_9GLOM|nr:unnamed protein product [Rhizophagus irregularis]
MPRLRIPSINTKKRTWKKEKQITWHFKLTKQLIQYANIGFRISGVRNRIDQRYLRGLDNTNYLSSHDPCSDKGKNSAKDRNKVILDPSSQFLFWLVDGH